MHVEDFMFEVEEEEEEEFRGYFFHLGMPKSIKKQNQQDIARKI